MSTIWGEDQAALAQTWVVASMSRRDNCYDNAVVERFFSTLTNELVHERDYHTREEAQAEVFELFYNRQRLHQTWAMSVRCSLNPRVYLNSVSMKSGVASKCPLSPNVEMSGFVIGVWAGL